MTWTLPNTAKSLALKAYLRRIAQSSKPIVLGPYRGELGFEHLYWIPFLHWCVKYAGISPERCLALSRGGMGVFYPAATSADLYTLRGVDALRLENQVDVQTRKIQKQTSVTDWDRQVAHEAADGKAHHLLHPAWMFWLLEDFWEERASLRLVANHTSYEPLPVPQLPDGFTLPEKFIAVRFYERHTFPLVPDVLRYAAEMVVAIAAQRPVVLLNQSLHADDHVDFPIKGPNVLTLPQVPPEQNFVLQAAVLARARAFVGTYGGVAQWALRYQVPSLSFYTHFNGTANAHWALSRHLSNRMVTREGTQGVPFEVADLRVMKLWRMALAPVLEEAAA